MPYYGDYYRGDYYRGDPGIFDKIFKGVKKLGGAALKVVKGVAKPVLRSVPVLGTAVTAVDLALQAKKAMGGRATIPRLMPGPLGPIPTLGPGYVAGGGRGGGGGFGGFASGGAKRPRMNVANPRALRRALRRVAGFGKLTKRARRDVARAAAAIGVRRPALPRKPFGRK